MSRKFTSGDTVFFRPSVNGYISGEYIEDNGPYESVVRLPSGEEISLYDDEFTSSEDD